MTPPLPTFALYQNPNDMYSEKDFEKLWFLYRTEGSPKGLSINSFCECQGVVYDRFAEWLRKRQKKIVPVQIEGMPSEESVAAEVAMPELPSEVEKANQLNGIQVTIQTRTGLHISQSNLDYPGLKELVEKLEGIC